MIEILRARLGCFEKARVGPQATTAWIRKELGDIEEDNLEIVKIYRYVSAASAMSAAALDSGAQLEKQVWFMAYRIDAKSARLPFNLKATRLLPDLAVPICVYGDAIIFDASAVKL